MKIAPHLESNAIFSIALAKLLKKYGPVTINLEDISCHEGFSYGAMRFTVESNPAKTSVTVKLEEDAQ